MARRKHIWRRYVTPPEPAATRTRTSVSEGWCGAQWEMDPDGEVTVYEIAADRVKPGDEPDCLRCLAFCRDRAIREAEHHTRALSGLQALERLTRHRRARKLG